MNAATRVEEKQKEIAEARRLYAQEMGQLTTLPKGDAAEIEGEEQPLSDEKHIGVGQ